MWEIFKGKIGDIQLECVPKCKIRSTKQKKEKWLNLEVRSALNEKKEAYNKLLNNNNGINLRDYKGKRDNVKRVIRKNKRLECIDIASDIKNSRKFYGYFNKNRKFKRKISVIKNKGRPVEGDKQIVREFNEYFSSVFNKNGDKGLGARDSLLNETGANNNKLNEIFFNTR